MSVNRQADRIDFGIDGPDVIRWNALGGVACLVLGAGLAVAGEAASPWFLIGGVIWLISPAGMLASSKWGKIRQREVILDRIGFHGDERVLDVGTGHGLMAIGAAQRLRTGQVVGIDIWQQQDQANNALANTRRNVELAGVADRCAIQDGDARAIPFPDASFDVVLANFALHNIPDTEGKLQACREVARVLKPGGRVFDYDMVFTTSTFVQGFAAAGLAVSQTGLQWRTYPPGRLIVGQKKGG